MCVVESENCHKRPRIILLVSEIIINFAQSLELRRQENKVGNNIMAKYTITYKCGHTAEVQLYGKHEERERKIKWYATINCPDCEVKEQREIAEKAGLPQLTGSEKQINWAIALRNDALNIINAQIAKLPEPNKTTTTNLRNQWIQRETAATYWIDRRYDLDSVRSIAELITLSINNK